MFDQFRMKKLHAKLRMESADAVERLAFESLVQVAAPFYSSSSEFMKHVEEAYVPVKRMEPGKDRKQTQDDLTERLAPLVDEKTRRAFLSGKTVAEDSLQGAARKAEGFINQANDVLAKVRLKKAVSSTDIREIYDAAKEGDYWEAFTRAVAGPEALQRVRKELEPPPPKPLSVDF